MSDFILGEQIQTITKSANCNEKKREEKKSYLARCVVVGFGPFWCC